jgi:hypothetical protein
MAEAVNRRRVNPVHSGVECGVNRGDRGVVVLMAPREKPACAAHRPGADAEWSDVNIAVSELSCLHLNLCAFAPL